MEISMEFPQKIKNRTPCWVQWLMPVILPTWEVRMGRIGVQGWPMQKVQRTPCQTVKAQATTPSYVESINRIIIQVSLGINARPYSKNN
jgi:hypothetical protein